MTGKPSSALHTLHTQAPQAHSRPARRRAGNVGHATCWGAWSRGSSEAT